MSTATAQRPRSLPEYPTKQEEIDYYAAFVARLPRASYLAMYLADTPAIVAESIRNDMACEPFAITRRIRAELAGQVAAERETLKAMAEEKAELQARVQHLEREAAGYNDDMQTMWNIATRVCKAMK